MRPLLLAANWRPAARSDVWNFSATHPTQSPRTPNTEHFFQLRRSYAATTETSTALAWQLDHAGGLQLLQHHVPVSGVAKITPLSQQQTRDLSSDTFSGQRVSAVDIMHAVTYRWEALTALTTHATQSWPLHSNLLFSTFATIAPSCNELRGYQHATKRALHRLAGW